MTETIKAILTGNNTIEIEGNTHTHRTPILHAARALAKEGRKGKIECYRNTVIAIVADIEMAAKLTVTENDKIGPYFSEFNEMPKCVFASKE